MIDVVKIKKDKLIVLTILAVAVFTCVGCADTPGAGGQGTDGQSDTPVMSRSEEPDGRAEKMNVAITIDSEDYAFPMPYEKLQLEAGRVLMIRSFGRMVYNPAIMAAASSSVRAT